jgi:hypothetical protein
MNHDPWLKPWAMVLGMVGFIWDMIWINSFDAC